MSYDPLVLLCRAHGLPAPETEVAFHPTRKFRADYCWRDAMVILEQHGGIWTKGAHARGRGLLRDYEKANAAQLLGYLYLQCTPDQITTGEILETLKEALR